MKQEIFPLPARPIHSHRSSAYFFQLVEIIGRSQEPTKSQLEALESSYRSTGEYLSACKEFDGHLIEIYAHGSRQLGTLVRPSDQTRDGFDIDLVARLDQKAAPSYSGNQGAASLLEKLHRVLERYAQIHSLQIYKWERCITLEYASGMCADIAPIIDDPLLSNKYGATHGKIPDRQLRQYQGTNPRGYAKYFNEVAAISPVFTLEERLVYATDSLEKSVEISPLPDAEDVFERLLCRLIQLLKQHRNIAFGPAIGEEDISPSSIFITSLAVASYAVEAPRLHASPLDLLLDIVETMPQYFVRSQRHDGKEEWELSNPSSPFDNLASGMNTPGRQKAFFLWHSRLIKDIQNLIQAIEDRSGLDAVLKLIESTFGKRAAGAVQQEQLKFQNSRREQRKFEVFPSVGASLVVNTKPHTFFGG